MAVSREAEELAARLRRLKEGTERSYGALARRLNVSASTLHRYCSGEAVPVEFAPIERMAQLCGASTQERVELHRLWILADAARRGPRSAGTAAMGQRSMAGPEAQKAEEPEPTTQETSGSGGQSAPEGGEEPRETGSAAGRSPSPDTLLGRDTVPVGGPAPWYRRYRWPATAAAAIAVILTLVALDSLAARPGGDGTPPSGLGSTASGSPERGAVAADPRKGSPEASAAGRASAAPSKPATEPVSPESPASDPSRTQGRRPGGKGGGPAGLPLAWTVRSHIWRNGCDHAYLIDRPKEQVPAPPAEQDAESWAASLGAVHGGETMVRISVQGKTSSAVVLEALRVRVVGRTAPVKRNVYLMSGGCGGSLTPRAFDVNLDASRPVAHPRPGHDGENEIPAVRFPYRVSASDPEVLLVTGRTADCDCRWYLELEWSSQGRSGTVRIDDHGRPFRTSGITGMPRYGYDSAEGRWVRE